MALQILGFLPREGSRWSIGTGYYVLIDATDIGFDRQYPRLDRCWLPGKEPRRAVKAVRPRVRRTI